MSEPTLVENQRTQTRDTRTPDTPVGGGERRGLKSQLRAGTYDEGQ